MSITPPQTPSPPPFQERPAPQRPSNRGLVKYGTTKDLRPVSDQDIRNETNNTQLDSSEIANSQNNIQINNSFGNFQEEWLMENFSVRPRHEVSASVTTNHRGDTYATVQYTHRFGVPKIAKKVREARLRGYEQGLAQQSMNSQIAWQTHCIKSINAGFVPKGCEGVYQTKIAQATSTHVSNSSSSPTGQNVRGMF